jgi:hypothetical protein
MQKMIIARNTIWITLRGMDWQQIVSLVIVGATALAFLWRHCRYRDIPQACETFCGCSMQHSSSMKVIFHRRKGEAPQVMIKM